MLLIVRAAVPELVTVTVWAALVVPTFWLLKIRLVGFNVTTGPEPLIKLLRTFAVALWIPAFMYVLP